VFLVATWLLSAIVRCRPLVLLANGHNLFSQQFAFPLQNFFSFCFSFAGAVCLTVASCFFFGSSAFLFIPQCLKVGVS
jgi:hypothetical protein